MPETLRYSLMYAKLPRTLVLHIHLRVLSRLTKVAQCLITSPFNDVTDPRYG